MTLKTRLEKLEQASKGYTHCEIWIHGGDSYELLREDNPLRLRPEALEARQKQHPRTYFMKLCESRHHKR
jgi:hypothetical protein